MQYRRFAMHVYYHDKPAIFEGHKDHISWERCQCALAVNIREVYNQMPDDEKLQDLSPEEFRTLFNESKQLADDCPVEELAEKRALMRRAIAELKTKVQAITVSIDDRRENLSRAEKLAISEADRKYKPKPIDILEPKHSTGDSEIDKWVVANIKPEERKDVRDLIKQLGFEKAKNFIDGLKKEWNGK